MKEYQGFAISNFRTGFDEAVEPWLLPRDAYQVVVNAHLYRGVLEKVEGYSLYATMSYRTIVSLGTPGGGISTFTITLPTLPTTNSFYAYGTVVVGSSAETFIYLSDGTSPVVNLVGSLGGSGTVNISTGVVTITFNTAPPAGTYSSIFFAYDSAPSPLVAIMGIKQYYAENESQQIMVFDQRRVGIVVSITSPIVSASVQAIQGIKEIPHDYYESAFFTGDGITLTFTGAVAPSLLVPGTIVINQYTSAGVFVSTVTDNGLGGLTGPDVVSGSINYVNGDYTITFLVAPANGNVFDFIGSIYGNIFTGSISNFFTLTNYMYFAFFTNSVDRIMYYDGTAIHFLNTNLSVKRITASGGIPNFDISRCLHVFTNQQRLLLIAPTVQGTNQVSGVWWSRFMFPLDFTNDESEIASTSEPIRAFGFINTDLILRFASSERIFRYTGDNNGPFRFDSTNNVWDCDAPYSGINYDTWYSSVGKPGITGSNGVNTKRIDEIIPDFTDPTRLSQQVPAPFMSQTSIQQCIGERFDDQKEGWMCYNSGPQDQTLVTASTNILAFNYIDETFAVYAFPFSCLGFGTIINVPTWATTYTRWEDDLDTWDSYQIQKNSLVDLGGDQFDRVFALNDGNTQTNVAGTTIPVLMNIVSKNFNPFIEQGQLARLGYVDLFVSANPQTTLNCQFYVNDQLHIDSLGNYQGFYQDTQLVFNYTDAMSPPPLKQIKVWKRIYVGAVGKEHTIRFYQNYTMEDDVDQPIYIHAMVLWMKPAGRIFQ